MAKVKTEAKKSVSRLTKEFKDFLNTSSNANENNNTTKDWYLIETEKEIPSVNDFFLQKIFGRTSSVDLLSKEFFQLFKCQLPSHSPRE